MDLAAHVLEQEQEKSTTSLGTEKDIKFLRSASELLAFSKNLSINVEMCGECAKLTGPGPVTLAELDAASDKVHEGPGPGGKDAEEALNRLKSALKRKIATALASGPGSTPNPGSPSPIDRIPDDLREYLNRELGKMGLSPVGEHPADSRLIQKAIDLGLIQNPKPKGYPSTRDVN